MINFFILFFVLFFSLNAKDLPRFYIQGFKSDKSSRGISKKIQNLITTELTSQGKNKFIFLDDTSLVGLLNQETKRIILGGKTQSDISKIADATKSKELILTEVKKEKNRYNINIRHISTSPYSIKSNISLYFYSYQTRYYSIEISKKILNPNYVINQIKAPRLSDTTIQVDNLKISNLILEAFSFGNIETKQEIILDKNEYKDDSSLAGFIEAMQVYIQRADNEYISKKYIQAAKTYENISNALKTLSKTDQRKLRRDQRKLDKRINSSYIKYYETEVKKIDQFYKSKKYQEAINGYKSLYKLILKDNNQFKNSKDKFLNILQNREKITIKELNNQDFLEKIANLDTILRKNSEIKLKNLNYFYKEYKKILENYKKLDTYIQTPIIKNGLKSRLDTILVQITAKNEQEGDDFLGLYQFKKSETSYQRARKQIENFYSNNLKKSNRIKINRKIIQSQNLGKNYYRNQIIAFSYFANTEKSTYILEKSMKNRLKARMHYNNSISSLKKARSILQNLQDSSVDWIQQDSINKYNEMINSINNTLKKNYQTYPFISRARHQKNLTKNFFKDFNSDTNYYSFGISKTGNIASVRLLYNKFHLEASTNSYSHNILEASSNINRKYFIESQTNYFNEKNLNLGYTLPILSFGLIPKIGFSDYNIKINQRRFFPNGQIEDNNNEVFTELNEKNLNLETTSGNTNLNSYLLGINLERKVGSRNNSKIYLKYDLSKNFKGSIFMNQFSLKDKINENEVTLKTIVDSSLLQANLSLQRENYTLGFRINKFYIERQTKKISYFYDINSNFSLLNFQAENIIDTKQKNTKLRTKTYKSYLVGISFNF